HASNKLLAIQSKADSELPRVTQWAIRRVLEDLRVAMAGLPVQSQSMEQLAKLFDEAKEVREEARGHMKTLGADGGNPNARGLLTLGSFREDAVLCVTTSAQ